MAGTSALLLLGPTACGKTALALELASRYPVEIISVDSALVYRGMDIGTAKPTREERAVCPHHLIDIREISEAFSAADFRAEALRLIGEIRARGALPLVVGGTMLYAKALREGIDSMPSTDETVRSQIAREIRERGLAALREELCEVDPESAARLTAGDTQRIARALEVFRMTGRPLSSFQCGKKVPDPTMRCMGLMPSDRAKVHEAISQRFDVMLRCGFVDEVRTLMARDDFSRGLASMRSVGYRQAIDFLEGRTDANRFAEAAKTATRRLAKHQMTWLRSMPEVRLLDPQTLGHAQLIEVLGAACEETLG